MLNALTIDLEDWYQVSNLEQLVSREDWGKCEDRLVSNTAKILGILEKYNSKATFFILGWNAARHSDLLRSIKDAGHEIGTHGYSHKLIYNLSPKEFSYELDRSIAVISDICQTQISGHRAPSFSITNTSSWAMDVLMSRNLSYDSSIFPIAHARYGIPDSPRQPYRVTSSQGELVEFPISTVRLFNRNIPFSGGAYFRFLPYPIVRAGFRMLNNRGIPVMFYLHPWEIDPHQPRMKLSRRMQIRCYHNLSKVEKRLERLLKEFEFGTTLDVLGRVHIKEYRLAEILSAVST